MLPLARLLGYFTFYMIGVKRMHSGESVSEGFEGLPGSKPRHSDDRHALKGYLVAEHEPATHQPPCWKLSHGNAAHTPKVQHSTKNTLICSTGNILVLKVGRET